MPGLLSNRSQPISDINLSIIELSSQLQRFQDIKDGKLEAKESETEPTALAHYETLHQIKQPIAMADVFDKAPGKESMLEDKSAKRLLIVGAPGVGKTTMSQYIANQWALNKLWPGKFDYVFWLPLRKLLHYQPELQTAAASIHIGGNVSAGRDMTIINASALSPSLSPEHLLAGFIHQECLESAGDISLDAIVSILHTQSPHTLLLLDGYDEVAHLMDDVQHPLQNRLLNRALKAEHVILTSRPYQLPNPSLTHFDRRLENTGFTDSNIQDYVTRYFTSLELSQVTQGTALLSFLRANLSVWGTTHIPINLALICEIWQEQLSTTLGERVSSSHALPPDLSMTGLYQQMTLFLLKRYLEKQGKKPWLELSSQLEADWIYKETNLELEFLCKLAFEGLISPQIQLTPTLQSQVLNKFVKHYPKISTSPFLLILQSGFLRRVGNDRHIKEIDKPHYFIHLTFQEYLAAFHLVSCLKRALTHQEHQDAIAWLQTEKYNSRYQVVLRFVAGLLSLAESIETNNLALHEFWKTLNNNLLDPTNIAHIRLIIPCLEEARDDKRVECSQGYLDLLARCFEKVSPLATKRNEIEERLYDNLVLPLLKDNFWVCRNSLILNKLRTALVGDKVSQQLAAIQTLRQLGIAAATSEMNKYLFDIWNAKDPSISQLSNIQQHASSVIEAIQKILKSRGSNDPSLLTPEDLQRVLTDIFGIKDVSHSRLKPLKTAISPLLTKIFKNVPHGQLESLESVINPLDLLIPGLAFRSILEEQRGASIQAIIYTLSEWGTMIVNDGIKNKLIKTLRDGEDKKEVRDIRFAAAYTLGRFKIPSSELGATFNGTFIEDQKIEKVCKSPEIIKTEPLIIAHLVKALLNERYKYAAAYALGLLGPTIITSQMIEMMTTTLGHELSDGLPDISRFAKSLNLPEASSASLVKPLLAILRDGSNLPPAYIYLRSFIKVKIPILVAKADDIADLAYELGDENAHEEIREISAYALGYRITKEDVTDVVKEALGVAVRGENHPHIQEAARYVIRELGLEELELLRLPPLVIPINRKQPNLLSSLKSLPQAEEFFEKVNAPEESIATTEPEMQALLKTLQNKEAEHPSQRKEALQKIREQKELISFNVIKDLITVLQRPGNDESWYIKGDIASVLNDLIKGITDLTIICELINLLNPGGALSTPVPGKEERYVRGAIADALSVVQIHVLFNECLKSTGKVSWEWLFVCASLQRIVVTINAETKQVAIDKHVYTLTSEQMHNFQKACKNQVKNYGLNLSSSEEDRNRSFNSTTSSPLDEMKVLLPSMSSTSASSSSEFTVSTTATKSSSSSTPLPLLSHQMIAIGRSSCVPEQLDLIFTRQEQAFCEYLEQSIVPYLQSLQADKPKPKCFVSYAWGNPYYEYKVEQLVLHLEKAGFAMLFDRWEERSSKKITQFSEKLSSADFVLAIGTEDYLRKYNRSVADNHDDRDHLVRLEARLINDLVCWSSNRSDKVITLLFENTAEKCFPPLLHPGSTCDFVQQDYFQTLLKLIHNLHGVSNQDDGFRNLMEGFRRIQAVLQTAISIDERAAYKNQQITLIQQQEAEEDRRIREWLTTKATHSQSSVMFAASLSSTFQPVQRNTSSTGDLSEIKQEIAAKKSVLSSETSSATTTSDKLTLKTGRVTAGRGIYRLVLTANPTLAANDMHAVTGDIIEIVIDSNTSVEKIKTVIQAANTLFSPTQTEMMSPSTSSSSSSSSSNDITFLLHQQNGIQPLRVQ